MTNSRHKALIAIGLLVFASVVLAACVAPGALNRWLLAAWSEPPRTYQVTRDMPFLADDTALRFATRLMSDEGITDNWKPREDRRTKAPDGTPDVYIVRNSMNPDNGYICFERAGANRDLSVHIDYEAEARTIRCQLRYPK